MSDVATNLAAINAQIEKRALKWDQDPAKVTLIAVSKQQPLERVVAALDAGHRVFGENRVQEAQGKWPALTEQYEGVELHLIGPLQSNKAADAVALFDVIQTVDRPKIAAALAKEMATGQHGNYDSMLIAQNGKLLFESYFKRGRVDLSHPQSSATKSYTSLALGRAMQLGYLTMDDLHKPVISFLDKIDRSKLVEGADKITLHHALTMTTGVKISDEGWEAINADLERINGQGEIQAVLEDTAPITTESQTFKYGTGPRFIMQVIDAVVPGTAREFIDKELFGKLGITNYAWRTAPSGLPESGWKVSVTSRDMMKMGLLASNGGQWRGEQLIHKGYLAQATQRQVITGDDDIFGGGERVSHQGYGYFWWGADVELDGKKHFMFSAQGGGGMYILVVKDFDLVVVVTAHERDDITQQLVAERILPLMP